MKSITNNIGVETKIYAETFEHEAYEQVKELVNSVAYQNSKVRIMPDAHAGAGCTIGTTMTISDKITPNLVGVDIGCGMLTVKLKEKEIDLEMLDRVIREYVPNGKDVHAKASKALDFKKLHCYKYVNADRAALSIGTLGGGNHFIEVSKSSSSDDLYLIIHSGSRNLGLGVCKYYQNLAIESLSKQKGESKILIEKLKKEGRHKEIEVELKKLGEKTINKDLAYLSGEDFKNYLDDMQFTQQFAILNRLTIANAILKNAGLTKESSFETIHNYIEFKKMILRKGAVSAEEGEQLLIPINMRDGSLLCIGKGNDDWNYSAPHGAGRLFSRSKAKEVIDIDDFKTSMKDVYTTCVNQSTLDEAPQAYKSIDEILSAVKDTVHVIDILKPIYNFKSN